MKMAFPLSSSGNQIVSVKLALISTGLLSLAVILKLSVFPVVTDFAVSELPTIYTSIISWLQPPYLYLVVNCIIISIVASSKFQLQKPIYQDQQARPLSPSEIVVPQVVPVVAADDDQKISSGVRSDYISGVVVNSGYGYQDLDVTMEKVVDVEEDFKAVPYRSDSMEFLFDKEEKSRPLVSARLGRRKSLKANPEAGGGGKAAALGVSKSKRHDTLESTWKTITDGRPMPLNRHLKKSDTWDTHLRRDTTSSSPSPSPPPKMKKAETFNDTKPKKLSRVSPHRSGKLKREPSLSQDELNRRVEAFINKFNEEMRLQRQESLNQYQEMVSGGAY